jgi:hypothetical protein
MYRVNLHIPRKSSQLLAFRIPNVLLRGYHMPLLFATLSGPVGLVQMKKAVYKWLKKDLE